MSVNFSRGVMIVGSMGSMGSSLEAHPQVKDVAYPAASDIYLLRPHLCEHIVRMTSMGPLNDVRQGEQNQMDLRHAHLQ